LVDALVLRVAVIINCVFLASDTLRDNCLCFVGNEAVNSFIRVNDEVETAWF
jgi:hypothetical protein